MPGDTKVKTAVGGGSDPDAQLAKTTKAPAYVIQPNVGVLRVSPSGGPAKPILTNNDYTEFVKRAQAAHQAQEVIEALKHFRL